MPLFAIARERDLVLPQAQEFESQTGAGVVGIVDGNVTLVGNSALMARYSISTDSLQAAAVRIAKEGKTPLWIAIDGSLAGIIAVADTIKPTSIHAIRQMHAEGLRVVMLTGDNEQTARAIAREAGVDEVIAGVLPAGKVDAIKRLQEEHRVVAMVGDGVNDAPALAQADVGLTMASGSDIAMEAGDVTLMRSDLTGVAAAIALSRATMRVMRQNLFWAFVYNVIGIPLAAGALYPVFGLLLSPVIASAAMALSSFSVVTNSLRLRRLNSDKERYGHEEKHIEPWRARRKSLWAQRVDLPGRKALGVDPAIKASNLRRLRRIEGQVRGLQRMVEEDRYCADILTQVSSAQEALRAVARALMRNHLAHCAVHAIRAGSSRGEAGHVRRVAGDDLQECSITERRMPIIRSNLIDLFLSEIWGRSSVG